MKHLEIEKIDFLQWLFRSEPIDDEIRLNKLEESLSEINFTFQSLIKEGVIGAVGTFPYSVAFGKVVSDKVQTNKGWITYFNLLEQENIINLPKDHWMIGLRPLAAGKIFDTFNSLDKKTLELLIKPTEDKTNSIATVSLAYCLANESVATNVLSINSIEQAKKLQGFFENLSSFNDKKIDQAIEILATSTKQKN